MGELHGGMTVCIWRHDFMPMETRHHASGGMIFVVKLNALHLGMTENWRHDLCVWRHDLCVEAGGMTSCLGVMQNCCRHDILLEA